MLPAVCPGRRPRTLQTLPALGYCCVGLRVGRGSSCYLSVVLVVLALQLMRARMKRSSKRLMRNVGGGRVGARLIETGAQLLNQLPTIARLLSGCVDCKAQAGIGCVPLL